jgi:hypothetical protein
MTNFSDLNAVWRSALDRFETPLEYETLAELARIRAVWLERAA